MILDPHAVAAAGADHAILDGEFATVGAREVHLAEGSVDHSFFDPPYSERAQSLARTNARTAKDMVYEHGFKGLTAGQIQRYATACAWVTRRWAVIFCDAESWNLWADGLAGGGMQIVRQMIWVRHGAPQISGDRPAQGHETMVLAHAGGASLRWNGRGKDGTYVHPPVRVADGRIHPAQKPLALMSELISDFTDPGEIVFDAFAGSGTTLLAARLAGRLALGVERDPKHLAAARRRVSSAVAR